jgi:S-adenosylmethionine hydrolase
MILEARIAGHDLVLLRHVATFGEAQLGEALILKDDYGRVELAINQDSFARKHPADIGESVTIRVQPLTL